MRNEQSGLAAFNNRLYKIWHGMKSRCANARYENYPLYGGRGISVCEEWMSFPAFVEWALSNGYSDSLTIDRKDTNGNYEPRNCKWSTAKQQARNRRDNEYFEFQGLKLCLPEWAERLGMKPITLISRVKRMGWPLEKALTTPVMAKGVKAC